MTEYSMFVVITALNAIGATMLIFGLFAQELKDISKVYKAAFILGAAGLLWQAIRNSIFLATGVSMADTDIPLWYMKDLALTIIGFYFAYLFKVKLLTLEQQK